MLIQSYPALFNHFNPRSLDILEVNALLLPHLAIVADDVLLSSHA